MSPAGEDEGVLLVLAVLLVVRVGRWLGEWLPQPPAVP